jgi:NAD-dependent deacetylase
MHSNKPKVVILTGAGVSAESGLLTFRDSGGLWENYDIMEVASIDGWYRNPSLIIDFYNERRKQAHLAQPNDGHKTIADLQQHFGAKLITQNVDDLHERAGSTQVLHLHGELRKVRSETHPEYVVDIADAPIQIGDQCPNGGQLRPHIVWFGEMVPLIDVAAEWCSSADILIVVGTSMEVYPAAGLVMEVPSHTEVFVVDPVRPRIHIQRQVHHLAENGTTGLPKLFQLLKEKYPNE